MIKAHYSKSQEAEINRLIGPAIETAKRQVSNIEQKQGPLSKLAKADLFTQFYHLEMDRLAKAQGLRI